MFRISIYFNMPGSNWTVLFIFLNQVYIYAWIAGERHNSSFSSNANSKCGRLILTGIMPYTYPVFDMTWPDGTTFI